MIDLQQLQKEIYDNKVAKGFNVTDIPLEFGYTYEELAEAFKAYRKQLPDLGEELADVIIYIMGLAAILHLDMEKELLNKVEKNKKREYATVHGKHVRIREG